MENKAYLSHRHSDDSGCPEATRTSSISTSTSASSGGSFGGSRTVMDAASMMSDGRTQVPLANWGFPGYLTAQEFQVFEKFSEVVARKPKSFRATLYPFGFDLEDEAHALCRWLRARKFNLQETIQMVNEATEMRRIPSQSNFYPDPKAALGVEPSVYASQYPQLYTGHCKLGAPLFISKPGVLNVAGLECCTTIDGILNFHWYTMCHDFANLMRQRIIATPEGMKRFECVCVIDLANLTAAQVSKRALHIVKVQSAVDSLCFPETLRRMIVINAPSFFSLTWKIMKGWIDERTAAKVEIITHEKKWKRRLLQLVDVDQLPVDYGGNAQSTDESLKQNIRIDEGTVRQVTHVLTVRNSASVYVNVGENEEMEVSIFTRSLTEGVFRALNETGNVRDNITNVRVRHNGMGIIEEEKPTRVEFPKPLRGPGKYKIKVECNTGAFCSENFLVLGKVVDNQDSTTITHSTPPTNPQSESSLLVNPPPQSQENKLAKTVSENETPVNDNGRRRQEEQILKTKPEHFSNKGNITMNVVPLTSATGTSSHTTENSRSNVIEYCDHNCPSPPPRKNKCDKNRQLQMPQYSPEDQPPPIKVPTPKQVSCTALSFNNKMRSNHHMAEDDVDVAPQQLGWSCGGMGGMDALWSMLKYSK